MRTERLSMIRAAALLAATIALPVFAQDAGKSVAGSEPYVPMAAIYSLIGLAVVQVIFILSLSSVMRTLGGTSGWLKHLGRGSGRAMVAIPLLLLASTDASAQAYKGDSGTMSMYHLMWWLVGVNIFLFVLLFAQIQVLRSMTRALAPEEERGGLSPVRSGPTWEQRLWLALSRRKPIDQEQDILMHHEYDGIRELDNVLPPWWLWLFYGTVIWGGIYLVNVHITQLWPKQEKEYVAEMTQAKADVEAYLSAQASQVDERNVVLLTNAGALAQGAGIFKQNCATCHGQLGEGTAGPNLTDPYWLHGGGIKEVFTTIKYGVSGKAMKSWKTDLKPVEMQAVASYVLSLQGTNPPNGKSPEGEIWKADPAAPAPADTNATPADTARMAVLP